MIQAEDAYETPFRVRTYSFRELAVAYFPYIHPHSASKAFRKLIEARKGLSQYLESEGVSEGCRTFPPIIVGGIVEFLGEP